MRVRAAYRLAQSSEPDAPSWAKPICDRLKKLERDSWHSLCTETIQILKSDSNDEALEGAVKFAKLQYRPHADVAYLRFSLASGVETDQVTEGINIEYDATGRVRGIEFLDAVSRLPAHLLSGAERYLPLPEVD